MIEELISGYRHHLDRLRRARTDPIVLRYLALVDTALQPFDVDEVVSQAVLLEAYVWECLHLSHWKDVEPQYRNVYGLVTWTLAMCYSSNTSISAASIHQLIDKGILLGSPDTMDLLLACHNRIQSSSSSSSSSLSSLLPKEASTPFLAPFIANCTQPIASSKFRQTIPKPIGTNKKTLLTLEEPDLMTFYTQHFLAGRPVVLRGCLGHWGALARWRDLQYLDRVGGHRLVPVELGSHYLSSDSGQALMTLRDFICQYIFDESDSDSCKKRKRQVAAETEGGSRGCRGGLPARDMMVVEEQRGGGDGASSSTSSTSSKKMGYVAQHCLFDQIPDLRKDIAVPDYCSLLHPSDEEEGEGEGDASDVLVNAWFGPVGGWIGSSPALLYNTNIFNC
jgi:[protein]-arginine 3-hydroxylase / protease